MLQRVKIYFIIFLNVYANSGFGWAKKQRLSPSEKIVPLTGSFWNCSENNGVEATLQNITCDCSLSTRKSGEIPLWANEFLFANSLTIQNCDKVVLQTRFFPESYSPVNLSSLHILNIGELVLVGKENGLSSFFPSIWSDRSEIVIPRNVFLENITQMTFDFHNPNHKKVIAFSSPYSTRTESFKLVNITINQPQVLEIGGSRSYRVKEFVMDKVQFRGHGDDSNQPGLSLEFTSNSFQITRSNFTELRLIAMDVRVATANVTDNNFGLSSRTARQLFFINSEIDISFSGNNLSVVGTGKFVMWSHSINITNNIFNYVSHKQVDIAGTMSIYKLNSSKILNLSNNVFHELDATPFNLSGNDFDEVIIFNNSIDCSCGNFDFFNNIKAKKEKHIYEDLLFSKNMSNTCANIENCMLHEVFNNLNELCEPNYKCSHLPE